MKLTVRVLGSAAGGGVPQWNCLCPNCRDARGGGREVLPRMQSSIAARADGKPWVLFNASPDLRAQLEALRTPGAGDDSAAATVRSSPIAAVVLTDAEIDHTAGLTLLREGGELVLYSTAFVHDTLRDAGVLPTLEAYLALRWREIVPDSRPVDVTDSSGSPLGLSIEAFAVAGDPPLYHRGNGGSMAGQTIGVRVSASGSAGALLYVPGAGGVENGLRARVAAADALLWDGTFWSDDELERVGVSRRRAADMGHLPVGGSGGSLAAFRDTPASRKVLVHVNNTNPLLREGSAERAAAEAEGWEVAYDGMELEI